MSAGLPLLIVNLLAFVILVAWMAKGQGNQNIRIGIGVVITISLLVCWKLIITYSVFNPIGANSMGASFIISFFVLFMPHIWKRIHSRGTQKGPSKLD